MTDGWGIFAALATAASAAFIGWQAFLTRKTITTAEAQVKAAGKQVDAANSQVRVAELARLDATAPVLLLAVKDLDKLELFLPGEGGRAVLPSETFEVPGDLTTYVQVQVRIRVGNQSPRMVPLHFGQVGGEELDVVEWIPPQGTADVTHSVALPVSDWIRLADEPRHPHAATMYVRYQGQRDQDIDDIWLVELHGSVLRQDERNHGTWRTVLDAVPPERASLTALIRPGARVYWKSRTLQETFTSSGGHEPDSGRRKDG